MSESIESTAIENQNIKTAILHPLPVPRSIIFYFCTSIKRVCLHCLLSINVKWMPPLVCAFIDCRRAQGIRASECPHLGRIFYHFNFRFIISPNSICCVSSDVHPPPTESLSSLIFIFQIFASHSSWMPILILPPSNVIGAIKDKVQVKLCRRQVPVCHCFFIHSPPFDLCLVFVFQMAFKIEFETPSTCKDKHKSNESFRFHNFRAWPMWVHLSTCISMHVMESDAKQWK